MTAIREGMQRALPALYENGQRAAHLVILDNGADHPSREGRVLRVRCTACGAESERLERSVRLCVARNATRCWQCAPVARLAGGGAKKHVLAAVAAGARNRAHVVERLRELGCARSTNHVSLLLADLIDEGKIERADGAYTLAIPCLAMNGKVLR